MAGEEGVKGISRITEASELAGKTLAGVMSKVTSFIKSPRGWITVAAVGVYGVVKLFDALTLSLAEAQEALDNSKKEYDESKEKLNSLGQQLNEVNTRIGELQGKGTLTIVEENELTKLKTVTEELKIQLEIQKELEKSKREELSNKAIDSIYAETNGFTRAEHIQQFSDAYRRLDEENNRILSGNETDERKNVQISHNIEQQKKLKKQALELSNALLEESKSLDTTDENAKNLYEEIQALSEATLGWAGEIESSPTDKVKDQMDGIAESMESLNKKLDSIQSAYQSLSNVIDEYNESGYISVDAFQEFLSLSPEMLQYFINEKGQLDLSKEALYSYTDALIDQATVKQMLSVIDYVSELNAEEQQAYLTSQATDSATESLQSYIETMLQAKLIEGSISVDTLPLLEKRLNAIAAKQPKMVYEKAGLIKRLPIPQRKDWKRKKTIIKKLRTLIKIWKRKKSNMPKKWQKLGKKNTLKD